MTNKTPVGTYRGPGRFETDFFRERPARHGGARICGIDRVEFRRANLVAAAELPYSLATICAVRVHEDDLRQRRLSGDAGSRCLKEIELGREVQAAGQADRRPLPRPRRRLLHRGRRRGPKETARLEANDDGTFSVYHGLLGGRAGRRNRVRADRRRRARSADGPHPRGLSRLDRLRRATATAPITRARW